MVHYALARIRVRVIPNSAHTHTIPEALYTNNILTRILYSNHFVTQYVVEVTETSPYHPIENFKDFSEAYIGSENS